MPKVVTRIAPSPTGNLHIGTARTALFNWLFARKMAGTFIVRIEDTDKERSTKEFEENIVTGLAWLGLSGDSIYRQSERGSVYEKFIEELLTRNLAYEKEEEHEGRLSTVIRFKNPNTTITFTDLIRGTIQTETTDLGDFVIARNTKEPLYHLAAVIDDYTMEVTHVIRGEDGISNTPRQILLQEALGAPRPTYAHIPFILGTDHKKLSKRQGSVSLLEYRDQGYLPEAMINFLALLGWHPRDDREFFTRDELITVFDLERAQKSGAMFDEKKLRSMNQHYLNQKTSDEQEQLFLDFLPKEKKEMFLKTGMIKKIATLTFPRLETLEQIKEMAQEGEFDYFFEETLEYKKELLLGKKGELSKEVVIANLQKAQEVITTVLEDNFSEEVIKEHLMALGEEVGRGALLWPVRVALSGREYSPDPFSLAGILGKEKVLKRLMIAQKKLE
jgi:glutamyl-tRNA synthetase